MRKIFKIKNWLSRVSIRLKLAWLRPLKFDKREFIVVILFAMFIGAGLGYALRMGQVEPRRDREMVLLFDELMRVRQFNRALAQDLANLEVSIKVLQGVPVKRPKPMNVKKGESNGK
jgi:hypothetical protein